MDWNNLWYIVFTLIFKVGLPYFLLFYFVFKFISPIPGILLGLIFGMYLLVAKAIQATIMMLISYLFFFIKYACTALLKLQASIYQSFTNRSDSSDNAASVQEPQEDKYKQFYELLGIQGTVTKETLQATFRAKIKMNHPDKLAQLDPELQKIAHKRTIAIKEAYEILMNKYASEI